MNYTNRETFRYLSIPCLIFLFLLPISFRIQAQHSSTKTDPANKNSIKEEEFILINDINQWVTIRGAASKPILLFLHGGPGSPMSPYSDSLFRTWERDFIIVQWDQRGAGKTFGYDAPEELTPEYLKANPLTLEQMVADGISLSEHLVKRLGKTKIILFGTSWGSALGVKMITKRPDLFYAYIGHSQIVNPSDDSALYNKVYEMAESAQDTASLSRLKAIGKPPYSAARSTGQLLRIVKKYERANSTPPPGSWFVMSSAYDNPKDNQNRENGDDYSFVNYVGDNRLEVQSMRAHINLIKDDFRFKIPVYFIQGNEDLLTPKESTKKYFDKIEAPDKKYYLLQKTAHGFNEAVLDALYKVCKSIKT
jgi:pimeloyl-ACP methyl ester carboxylesterase